GGLPSVKAVGIALKTRGIAQVSMNLTNYEETPVHVAYEAVKAEAAKHGVEVQSSEVIGLIPEAAVAQVAGHYLKLENFSMSQILEARMAQVMTRDLSTTVGQFLEAVSAHNVAPGGGSVAALTGAAAMALGVMVAGRLLEKETQPQKVATLRAKRDLLVQLRDRLQAAIREDAAAYNAVLQSSKRPMLDPERGAALQQSLNVAIAVPLAIMEPAVPGVDRSALDVALELGMPAGGWCPKGRKAEDGSLSSRYPLTETPSEQYWQRTEWNVRDSDGTLVLTRGAPAEGTAYTIEVARKSGK